MSLPENASVVVVRGFWLDETTGQGVRLPNSSASGTVTFTPLPLNSLVPGTKTPNLRDLEASGFIKTRPRVATANPVTGYFATLMVANDDPDLDAYGGRLVQFSGEDPFVIAVPHNAPFVSADTQMVEALSSTLPELEVGDQVRAVWLTAASLVTTPVPTPPVTYLTAEQTLETVESGVEAHAENTEAHPDIRDLIEQLDTGATGGAGGVLSGTYPNPGFAVDMATQAELNAVAAAVPEQARDALGAALVQGANVTITPDDAGDTITISATVPTSYSDEQAQDAFAALIAAGAHSGITFAYSDVGNAISATVSAQSWSQITGKPTFATVATSGSYTDLSNKPTIPTTAAGISDFTEAVQDAVAALLGAGSNITLNYDDAGNTLTVSAAGGGGGLDAEAVRDTIGVALVGTGNIAVTVNDALDTITITTTATVNSTDAQLRDRSTHTGQDPISAVTGLQTALDGKQPLDSDLTTISGLDAAQSGALATDGAGWVRKTYAQLKTALGLVKADVGLSNVDNTADNAKPVSTAAQTALDAKVAKGAQVVDAADYGLTTAGTASANLTALNAAVAAVPATGGRLLVRPGTYSINPWTITGKHGLVLDGPGAVLSCATGTALTVTGTRTTAATTITADVATGANTVTVASAAGLAVGDLIVIRTSSEVFDPERPTQYYKGELAWIGAISGTTVTLESRTFDSYSATAGTITIDKIAPIRDVALNGLRIIGGGAGQLQVGIDVRYFADLTVSGTHVIDCEQQGVVARVGVGAKLVGNVVERADGGGLGYGVRVLGVHDAILDGNTGRKNRHTIDVDYELIPSRGFAISNNHAEDDLSAGISTHGGAAHGSMTTNITRHCGGGLVVRSADTFVSGNTVVGTKTVAESSESYLHGITIGDGSPHTIGVGVAGRGLRVVDNRVDLTHSGIGSEASRGIHCTVSLVDAQVRGNRLRGFSHHGMWFAGDTIRGGHIVDNDIDCAAQVGTPGSTFVHGIFVEPANSSVSGNNAKQLTIARNVVAGALYSAVRLTGNTSTADRSSELSVVDNFLRNYGLRGIDFGSGYFGIAVVQRNNFPETAVNQVTYSAAGWTTPPDQGLNGDVDRLPVGEATIPRLVANASATAHPGSGIVWLTYFTARRTESIGNIRVPSGNTAAAATPTLVRFGLFEEQGDGSLALVGATANDTAVFAAAFGVYTRALTAAVTKVSGRRYAVGILVVSAAAMPTLYGLGGSSAEYGRAPAWCSQVTGQTDLPSTIATGSLSTSAPGKVFLAAVLP